MWARRILTGVAFLGAILLTGDLGGAVASDVRAGTPALNLVIPVLFALLAGASPLRRNKRLESIIIKS